MATFAYEAYDSNGAKKKATIDADNIAEATQKVKDNGLTVISIKPQGSLDQEIHIPGMKKKVSPRDFSVFCRQFSSILKAGVSIVDALEMMADQTENKTLKAAVVNVQSAVEKGENLSTGMKRNDDVFPSLFISMVEAGEASGGLESSIERMANQFEKDAKLKGLLKSALTYPIVLIIVMIAVVVVMITKVVPSFVTMFEDLGTQLPFATRFVIALSDIFLHKWWLIAAVVIAIVVGRKLYLSNDKGKHMSDANKLKTPLLGQIRIKTACAQFSRTLATLLAAGMPVMDAIQTTANTMDNLVFKEALEKVRTGVSLGLSMSSQLKAVGCFPPLVYHMVGIGEETGSAEGMLNNVAVYYDEEVEQATKSMTTVMEPLIIIVMALVVGGIIAAVYGPMITLYNTLG